MNLEVKRKRIIRVFEFKKIKMRFILLKLIAMILLLIAIIWVNLMVFRSDYPNLWFITALLGVFGIIFFPYEKLLNNKKK